MEQEEEKQNEFLFKIVIVGNSNVGKTNILSQYCDQKFLEDSKNTIGVDFKIYENIFQNQKLIIQFWDTAGQEKFKAMSSALYKNAHGAILVYDITNEQSLIDLDIWKNEIQQYSTQELQIIVLGNKKDLLEQRIVKSEEGEKYASNNGFFFMEVSAKDNTQKELDQAMEKLYEQLLMNQTEEKIQNHQDEIHLRKQTVQLSLNNQQEKKETHIQVEEKKKCC